MQRKLSTNSDASFETKQDIKLEAVKQEENEDVAEAMDIDAPKKHKKKHKGDADCPPADEAAVKEEYTESKEKEKKKKKKKHKDKDSERTE